MNNLSYLDRQLDLAAFQGFSARASQLLPALAAPGRGGEVLTGLAKLGQRFLLELFTEKGSLPFAPAQGSTFMTEARQGYIRTPADLTAAFTRAMLDIRQHLVSDTQATDPLDEQFADATLQGVDFSPGAAQLTVALASQDPAAQLILPVPFVF